ncbi:MAG: hypothetical protein IV298_01320 [Cylindrospermopsis raciborskii KL1]|uniref:hypothetical protein n=1 Tax=Cylindrospermopsis raciborskii TaxID=77022 RepID=UPI001A226C07|nr:hypothetical protein [Cylindrospermopsis raciborskii]MBG0742124.1 hypothetical protein [Cylindrospermopsis raciborskii KL1]
MSQDKKLRSKQQLPEKLPIGVYHKKPPFWKILIIQVLRGTIGILERMVTRLETSSTTPEKGGLLLWVVRKWDGFLRGFRLFLPSKVANNVSDGFLTLIFAFLAVLAIGVTATSLISQIGSQPVTDSMIEGKTQPQLSQPVTDSTVEGKTQPQLSQPPTDSTVEGKTQPQLSQPPTDSTVEGKTQPQLSQPPTDSTVEGKTQPQLSQPPTDSMVEGKIQPQLSQPPTDSILKSKSAIELVELIPQQEVTGFIEKKLKAVTATSIITKDKQKTELELVQSIKTNFRISEIVIKITEDWYKLESSQQEKLAAQILKSCQEMDLIHVKILNTRNQLIARSPVIGTKMVFFQFPTS